MQKINLRLNVTKEERDMIRRAAALRGFRSMAEFCRFVVLTEAAEWDLKDKIEQGQADTEEK